MTFALAQHMPTQSSPKTPCKRYPSLVREVPLRSVHRQTVCRVVSPKSAICRRSARVWSRSRRYCTLGIRRNGKPDPHKDRHRLRRVHLRGIRHAGTIRPPDAPTHQRTALTVEIIERYSESLQSRRIVTIRGGSIRISLPPYGTVRTLLGWTLGFVESPSFLDCIDPNTGSIKISRINRR